jgi:PAS domain S-box-containing protein
MSSLTSHRVMSLSMALSKTNSESYGSLLEAIVRSSDDAILTKNLSSIVTSWNPAAARIFGWDPHEIIGHSVLRLIPPRLQHEELEILRRLRAGEQMENCETVRVTRDGREIIVSLTLSPLRNHSGQVTGASIIARNVTEKRAAERMRLQLAAIVESSDDAIISKNLDGTIISWNAGAERMFGYKAAEIVGQSLRTLLPPNLHDEEATIIARLIAGLRVDHFETLRVRRNGEIFPVSLSVSPIRDDAGEVAGAAGILRDITQHRHLEQSLLHAEKMAAAARLASELAHEVNNPLEALTNLLYLAQTQKEQPAALQKSLGMAEVEVERLARLTRQILGSNQNSVNEATLNVAGLEAALR